MTTSTFMPKLRCSQNAFLSQNSTAATTGLILNSVVPFQGHKEELVIPRRKTWDKLAVLQALASTVNRDPTAAHYLFQDDPYLIPKTSAEFRVYSLSQESGRSAARYIFNNYPTFFEKNRAEPLIPCLMPQNLEPQIGDVSEAALKERIQLRRVKDAVDVYDQLVQAGTQLSLETMNSLLDLICYYGDRDPVVEDQLESKESENEVEVQEENSKRRKGRFRKSFEQSITWRENNNAERIFNLMQEKNEHSFCTLIQGMVKYGAYNKAFSVYTDLLNNRMNADVHTFNSLILATPEVREKYNERGDLITDLLRQMAAQNVKPNLLTFNSVLKSLRKCGALGRSYSLQTLNEMKALQIEPSLATFDHIIGIFYKFVSPGRVQSEIIYEVMDEIEQKNFVARDPDDVNFFANAMKVCLDLKDVELAYRLHKLLETGDNWKLLGDFYHQSIFYGRFFNLLCMMEHIDVVLRWYRQLIPSASFADCALDIKSSYESQDRGQFSLEWTASALGNITKVFLQARKIEEAWKMIHLFKAKNRLPREELLNEFMDLVKEKNDPVQAIELIKLAAACSLPVVKLASRAREEFLLSEEQKMLWLNWKLYAVKAVTVKVAKNNHCSPSVEDYHCSSLSVRI
ncbi:pentatricopeptide repeat domain-containing protein 3, mitochondrial [Protopterus annectens]|uniref:pentatricopeptide repeat domain-containing protein 3, mitochondrial n=1 Tax=Protopterus annectens TaxID=7888 RepID=UPI001CF9B4DF|nr:pentatricopeptide repeat domain-containing protein 3, mitochondrial [Protopterus annectens]